MHPPAGGGIAGFLALTAPKGEPLRPRDAHSPRRFPRAKSTGVMLPNHRRRRLRLFAALPPVPLFLALPLLALLLLSAPLPAASGPITCPKGNTWDSRLESCRACSHCTDVRAPYVLLPCEPHRDTQCGPLSALGIDWSFLAGSRRSRAQQQQLKRGRRPGGQSPGGGTVAAARSRPASGSRAGPPRYPSSSPPTTPSPAGPLDAAAPSHPRPRGSHGVGAAAAGRSVPPEVAARLMDLEAGSSGSREDLFLLPEGSESRTGGGDSASSGVEDVSPWGWRHWLAAGVSIALVCALALVLAPSALKGLRKRCSHPGRKGRHRDKTKGQHNKIVKSDQTLAKSSQRTGDRGRGLHSSNHHTLNMEELLASGWGSLRLESKNVYIEDAPGGAEKLLPPQNTSVLVASTSPGMVQSVRVELQEDIKNKKLSSNCLGLDCASRTMFIGRSSSV
ncbi:uncharacterized protein wgn [Hetaerina americana]|uniref:uncharacterized protein wgn n=1 Tax=Hetaerina americana TaxID=62018 RepID=UPI003A7F3853